MHRILLALLALTALRAADVCPSSPVSAEARSWTAKIGSRHCVASAVSATGAVTWPAAGILRTEAAGRVEFAMCCFAAETDKPAPVRIAGRELTVPTHQEAAGSADEDEFPDLIEDDARTKSVSIRGTLGDAAHPIRVDILLKCSASKFADQFAFQFTVIDRSADRVEVVWDHLRDLERRIAPSVQAVAGGKAWVFLTRGRPHEAPATIEVRTPSGVVLGRFRFDGFTLSS
jgi:hypothetical protein